MKPVAEKRGLNHAGSPRIVIPSYTGLASDVG